MKDLYIVEYRHSRHTFEYLENFFIKSSHIPNEEEIINAIKNKNPNFKESQHDSYEIVKLDAGNIIEMD